MGTASSDRPYRHVVARAFEHGEMARTCKSFRGGTLPQAVRGRLPAGFVVPDAVRQMAEAFLVLQEMRHRADYDSGESFRRSDVEAPVDRVEVVVRDWSAVRRGAECRFFLLSLLTWNRLTGRA